MVASWPDYTSFERKETDVPGGNPSRWSFAVERQRTKRGLVRGKGQPQKIGDARAHVLAWVRQTYLITPAHGSRRNRLDGLRIKQIGTLPERIGQSRRTAL